MPFSLGTYWTISPLGYLVGGVSDAYRIDLFRCGSVLRIERDHDAVPVDPEERPEIVDCLSKNMRKQVPGWRWNGPPVPATNRSILN